MMWNSDDPNYASRLSKSENTIACVKRIYFTTTSTLTQLQLKCLALLQKKHYV